MKSKYSFEIMELDDSIVAVPVGDNAAELHAVLNINEEAKRILELLREDTTSDQIVSQLMKEYIGEEDHIRLLVDAYLDQLRQEGFLEE